MSAASSLTALAPAKVNLALVVGPLREDGKHEVATVLQRLELGDRITVRRATAVAVDGFPDDTLVTAALQALEARTGAALAATIEKCVPVAAGLGGGSSDAATALRLGNELLGEPLDAAELHRLAAGLGADVPFFLEDGPALGTGDGTDLAPLVLPQDYVVLLAAPHDAVKGSTASVYAAFDARRGETGFPARRAELLRALGQVVDAADLSHLPRNDLASSPLAGQLEALGAFRADVSGAGPTVYGLFADADTAAAGALALEAHARTWITTPRWYR